jgi:hypothetical protein
VLLPPETPSLVALRREYYAARTALGGLPANSEHRRAAQDRYGAAAAAMLRIVDLASFLDLRARSIGVFVLLGVCGIAATVSLAVLGTTLASAQTEKSEPAREATTLAIAWPEEAVALENACGPGPFQTALLRDSPAAGWARVKILFPSPCAGIEIPLAPERAARIAP